MDLNFRRVVFAHYTGDFCPHYVVWCLMLDFHFTVLKWLNSFAWNMYLTGRAINWRETQVSCLITNQISFIDTPKHLSLLYLRWPRSVDSSETIVRWIGRCCGAIVQLPIRCYEAKDAISNDESRDCQIWVSTWQWNLFLLLYA